MTLPALNDLTNGGRAVAVDSAFYSALQYAGTVTDIIVP